MKLGFFVPICVRNIIHLNHFKRCVNSIRRYHIEKIVIIDDSDEDFLEQINSFILQNKNIERIKTLQKGSADQQVFKFFLENSDLDKMIFIQDSVILNKKLMHIEDISFKFIWHFTNHIQDWEIIKEPRTQYNKEFNIINHTDLIRDKIKKKYPRNKMFIEFCMRYLDEKHMWCGCFGSMVIIEKEILRKMDGQVPFVETFVDDISNRDRRANESIFALISHFVFPEINFRDSYDGLYYDGVKYGGYNEYVNKPTGFDNLKWCSVHEYFSKISFNR